MSGEDLELVSTRELVEELMRRTTFMGIIVHAAEEAKHPRWEEERIFKVHFNRNLDAEQVGRLLGVVGEYMTGASDRM
jgi:hypothetical protein